MYGSYIRRVQILQETRDLISETPFANNSHDDELGDKATVERVEGILSYSSRALQTGPDRLAV